MSFLSRWLTSPAKAAPKTVRPCFRPVLQSLDDRITPTFGFAAQKSFLVGPSPNGAAVADFNGDGQLDLVSANTGDNTVSVLLNTQAGTSFSTFAAQQTFAVGNGPTSVGVGDFNGDGRPDIVSTNFGNRNGNTVSILLNTTPNGASMPTFAAQQVFTVGYGPISVAVGDFNGDGRADIVTTNFGGVISSTVSVLLNTTATGSSTPTFATQQAFTVGGNPISVAIADFNSDGRADIVTANVASRTVSVLLSTTPAGASTPAFATHQTFTVGSGPTTLDAMDGPISVAVGDFNGDGRADIVTANNDGNNNVSVLLNTTAAGASTPTFTNQSTFAIGNGPISVTVGDFNGDGLSDIAAANSKANTVSVLLNETPILASTPAFANQRTVGVGSGPASITVGDFDGDGRHDLVTTNSSTGTVSLLLNNTTDAYTTTPPAIAGQFGNTRVWAYNRSTGQWGNLTQANADALATAPNGNMVASFGGNGVWYYRPLTGWVQLSNVQASAVAIDTSGNAYINFGPAYGTYQYNLAMNNFIALSGTTAGADKLAVNSSGDVIANFNGYGLYEFRWTTGWTLLTNVDATALAAGPTGDVAASFVGYGTYLYNKTDGWQQINGVAASSLAVGADGAVAAVFAGYGVAKYVPYAQGWASLTDNAAGLSVAMDLYGNIFASFNGGGVWEFNAASGWHQRNTADANLLSVGR